MDFKIEVDNRRVLENGEYPIRLRIYNNRKYAYSPIGISAKIEDFDSENGLFMLNDKTKRDKYQRYNFILTAKLNKAVHLWETMAMRGERNISALKFKDLLDRGDNVSDLSFKRFFEQFIENKEGNTKRIYRRTLDAIQSHNRKELYFEDITYSWLESFENKLKKDGLATNTISIHFRNIRAVINNAIDKEIIGLELYPFRRFKVKSEKTRKQSVSVEHLRTYFETTNNESWDWVIDVTKLTFLLIGINAVDLYNLKKSDYDGNFIYYKRSKTKAVYQIKVEPEAKELIEKYKGEKNLLNFADTMTSARGITGRISKHIKHITNAKGLPNMIAYSMRHSWATLAAEIDIPKETISAALGHSSKSVTDIYIDFNRKKIDEANRKVIDYVLKD